VNIAVHFIRARRNLIIKCSTKGFPIYSLISGKRERQDNGGERGEELLELMVVVIFQD